MYIINSAGAEGCIFFSISYVALVIKRAKAFCVISASLFLVISELLIDIFLPVPLHRPRLKEKVGRQKLCFILKGYYTTVKNPKQFLKGMIFFQP